MTHLFVRIMFFLLIFTNLIYSESKYRDKKQKVQIEEKIPGVTTYTSEQDNNASTDTSPVVALTELQDYWIGILFYPKKGQTNNSSLETNVFKNIAYFSNKTKKIKIYGENIFKEKLKQADISEKSIQLSPEFVIGRQISNVNGIIVVSYFQNPLNKNYTVEIKYVDLDAGNLNKLSIDDIQDKDLDKKIGETTNNLVAKIQTVISKNKDSSQNSDNISAEDYFENGRKANVNSRYKEAIQELEKAIQLEPKMTKAYLELSNSVFKATNKREEQVKVLERGIKNSPKDLELHLELGKLYAILNDKKKAKEQYNYIIIMDKEGKTDFSKLAERLMKMLYEE